MDEVSLIVRLPMLRGDVISKATMGLWSWTMLCVALYKERSNDGRKRQLPFWDYLMAILEWRVLRVTSFSIQGSLRRVLLS